MRSRYWWLLQLWAEFIRAETLIMEWSELCSGFDYSLAFVFPLTNFTEISLLAADWHVKHRVTSNFPPCLCFKAQILRICWRSLSTVSPDVLFFPPPPYNQTLLSPLLPVSVISTLHPEGLTNTRGLKVSCPYSAFMNLTYVLWEGSAWLHDHPTLPLNP